LANLLRKLRSRSWSEIRFRLGQEATNLRLFASPPRLSRSVLDRIAGPCPVLPDPAAVASRLKTTAFAAECLRIADEIMDHRFPLLGGTLETGPQIHWRRDYTSGLETPTTYFRRIPYLDAQRAGDHKNIWELNRHQHLVLLAQAYLLSDREAYFDEIVRQVESWLAENPFQSGINWTSALEVAFRALSWIWIYHLTGGRFSPTFRQRFLDGLYWHGLHLESNLSYYFSPNTHLLGEAVALHAIGRLFPHMPRAKQWQETGARVVRNELDRQVLADGCHFERSTYYHVYALDMFQFHAILRGLDDTFREALTRMAVFLDTLLGCSSTLPYLGDDDGGRFFHPYGIHNRFGLATMATSGVFLNRPEWIRDPELLHEQADWWLATKELPAAQPRPPAGSTRFAASGLLVMAVDDVQLIVDTGTFGPGSGGHSHADTLSLVLRVGGEQILIDPGTYTYVGDPAWRNRFRGTAAHNTVRINELDQAVPAGPFAWQSPPEVEVLQWESSAERDLLLAACSYAGFRHQRTVVFRKDSRKIEITDRLEGTPGEHRLQQFWHFGAPGRQCSANSFQVGSTAVITVDKAAEVQCFEGGDYGWTSPALAVKSPAPTVLVERLTALPASFTAVIDLSAAATR
jgi:hypothetical protein